MVIDGETVQLKARDGRAFVRRVVREVEGINGVLKFVQVDESSAGGRICVTVGRELGIYHFRRVGGGE